MRKSDAPDASTVLGQQISKIESDIENLRHEGAPPTEGHAIHEILSHYGRLDEQAKRNIKAYGILAKDEVSRMIEEALLVHGSFEISFAADGLRAFLEVSPPEGPGKAVTEREVLEHLAQLKVVFGLNAGKIHDLLVAHEADRSPIAKQLIATGVPAVSRTSGGISFLYAPPGDFDESLEDPCPRVCVRKGQLIARLRPQTEAMAGRTVFGTPLEPVTDDSLPVEAGENIRLEADTGDLYSLIDGALQVKNRVIHVRDLFIVEHDVDSATGDILFAGAVLIMGSVRDGFAVKANGDVDVEGFVEGATVISQGGSVRVSGGIAGMGRCYVCAGKDVEAKYIENGTVWARETVRVGEAILKSNVSAGVGIEALAGKGVICGGRMKAGESVKARVFGSRAEVATELALGIPLELQEKIGHIEQKRAAIRQIIARINLTVENSIGQGQNMDSHAPEVKEQMVLLRKKALILSFTETKLAEEQDLIEKHSPAFGKGFLFALCSLYPNVAVSIGNAKYLAKREHGKTTLEIDPETREILPL
jgi:hypothetical protein